MQCTIRRTSGLSIPKPNAVPILLKCAVYGGLTRRLLRESYGNAQVAHPKVTQKLTHYVVDPAAKKEPRTPLGRSGPATICAAIRPLVFPMARQRRSTLDGAAFGTV